MRKPNPSNFRVVHRTSATNPKRTIAIVGGGFAGTTLARALDSRLPPDRELMLISEESYTTFNPTLPEAVGASIFPEQLVARGKSSQAASRIFASRAIVSWPIPCEAIHESNALSVGVVPTPPLV
jgi:hypothetical protein